MPASAPPSSSLATGRTGTVPGTAPGCGRCEMLKGGFIPAIPVGLEPGKGRLSWLLCHGQNPLSSFLVGVPVVSWPVVPWQGPA